MMNAKLQQLKKKKVHLTVGILEEKEKKKKERIGIRSFSTTALSYIIRDYTVVPYIYKIHYNVFILSYLLVGIYACIVHMLYARRLEYIPIISYKDTELIV